jgi:hypothetical protein
MAFWWENLRERDHWGDPGIVGKVKLRWIFKKWNVGVDWVELAQDMNMWGGLVNAIMNLRVP